MNHLLFGFIKEFGNNMSEIQIGYILLSLIFLLFFFGVLSIVCSIIFEYRNVSDYKFSPPSSHKKLSFDTEEDDIILINSDPTDVIGDFDDE